MGYSKAPGNPEEHRKLALRHLEVVRENGKLKAEVERLNKENSGLKAWLALYQRKAGHITITTDEREGLPCPYPMEED